MTQRADMSMLDELHRLLSESWKARLQDGEPLTAAEATSLAKFLADNGIKGLPSSPRIEPLQAGLDALKEIGEDEPADLNRFRTTAATRVN